jgi:uncharacterized protein YcbK (DUF882 family)
MGTWVKETDKAIYLMAGNAYIAALPKRPSQTNPEEQVVDVTSLKSWFARSDKPRAMTVSVGTDAPEPSPAPTPPSPGDTGLVIDHNGQLKVVKDTYFKVSPKQSGELGDRDKVLVRNGAVFAIRYYTDAGNYHWLVELVDPTLGDGTRTAWYVFTPDIRLGTDAVLIVTYDTLFKLEPKPSTELPNAAKVFVEADRQFKLASFMPAVANHTQIELADTTLGPNNGTLWYVYNLHAKADTEGDPSLPHDGMQIQALKDTYFTLSPKPPGELPEAQKVLVKQGTIVDIQYYLNLGDNRWQIELVKPTLGDGKATTWYVDEQETMLLSAITLTVNTDTVFKQEPKPSSQLPSAGKVSVKRNTQFPLVNYLPAAGDHTKVKLADAGLGSNQQTTWYVYNPHITIAGQRQLLQVVGDTVFKTSPVLSSELPEEEKVLVRRNAVFEVSSYAQPEKNHVRLALKGAFLGPQNRNTWYGYVSDIYIVGTEIGNNPDDQNNPPPPPSDRGIPLKFPGFSGTYYSNDPIYWKTQYGERGNFTWGEALHVNRSTGSYRRPASADVIYGILRIAKAMEDIRKRLGNRPITVNSWYRDPATNAAVGGASQSRHLLGDAVDFVVSGVHPYDVYANLDAWWGNQGGLASSKVFTHIDARSYKARWNYDGSGMAKAAEEDGHLSPGDEHGNLD